VADDTYDPARIQELLEALRELARRLMRLDAEGRLLDETPSLLKELGDVRSELFQYEVRTTYDTPETAEHRRIVNEAAPGWVPDSDETDEEDEGWHPPESR
jgi:hypothetical protein